MEKYNMIVFYFTFSLFKLQLVCNLIYTVCLKNDGWI